tara:strand:+ start:360 stop:1427 length:1068 start_codon:yes stop_codon:yes gene_type:complete
MKRFVLYLLVGWTLLACTPPEQEKEIVKKNVTGLKQGLTDFDSKEWANIPSDDSVIATVNGVPLSRKSLERQIAERPEIPVRELLNRMIEMEVMAQKAAQDGYGLDKTILKVREKAVARAYLRDIFEQEVTPESISEKMVKDQYQRVKHMFWHDHDEIRAVQLMETCCDAGEGKGGCETEEELACFAEAAPRIAEYEQELRKRLAEVERTPAAIKKVMADYRSEIDTANPNLRYEDIQKPIRFVVGQSHEWHRGKYDVFAREVVEALFSLDELELSSPVQSSFGWHLLVKLKHYPARHWTEDDPRTIAEIRERAFPYYRKGAFKRRLQEIKEKYSLEVNDRGLKVLDELTASAAK